MSSTNHNLDVTDNREPDLSQIPGYDEEMKRQAEEDDKAFMQAMEKTFNEDMLHNGVF